MAPPKNAKDWYEIHADEVGARYEKMNPDELHAWFVDLLPKVRGTVIDVGAGTGRDAAWFASKGFDVIAVEPSENMRAVGEARRGPSSIHWTTDSLPSLSKTLAIGAAADVVFLGAVWMHLPVEDRPRAFRKLVSLTKSGGLIVMTIRNGPSDDERVFHPASVFEIETLARAHGLVVVRVKSAEDSQKRDGVSWDCVVLRLPDDGTDALPLLRHVILNDAKTSTYKLGLLRSLCRVAEGAAGMARESGDDHVAVPLGLVAVYWLRLYLPLVSATLPQSPINDAGGKGLGFFNGAVANLKDGTVPAINLRVGASFSGGEEKVVHSAIGIVAQTIVKNPATYTTYPRGGRIFLSEPGAKVVASEKLFLDAPYLASFGWLKIPRDVWRAMQRFGSWIEPSVVAEWIRLMKGYATSQERILDEGSIAAAMTWTEPDRDVAVARGRALELLRNAPIKCVWTGDALDASTLDMDHAFPWSAWPCGDLWNLVPSHRRINQHKKRDKLPSDKLLLRAHDNILSWWRDAYEKTEVLSPQFISEAKVSLPALADEGDIGSDGVFAAMRFQRLRLARDQQIPEWNG